MVASEKEHKQSVHEGKKYPCDACDNLATQKGDLRRHKQSVHEGKKPFLCDICDYRAGRKTHLRSHKQRVHHSVIKTTVNQIN